MLTLVSAASKTFADNTSPVNPWLKINEFKFTFFIGSNLKALLGPEPAAVARPSTTSLTFGTGANSGFTTVRLKVE